MNQGILFPELADWQPHEQRIHFPAQQMGALVDCYISRRRLEKMTGLSLARRRTYCGPSKACVLTLKRWLKNSLKNKSLPRMVQSICDFYEFFLKAAELVPRDVD